MVRLVDKYVYMHPTADPELFGISDDGAGQQVAEWRQPFPQPTQEELDAVPDAEVEADILLRATERLISNSEDNSARLFFHLCKTLIDAGVINANDPNMVEIKTAYQEWKTLKGI